MSAGGGDGIGIVNIDELAAALLLIVIMCHQTRTELGLSIYVVITDNIVISHEEPWLERQQFVDAELARFSLAVDVDHDAKL